MREVNFVRFSEIRVLHYRYTNVKFILHRQMLHYEDDRDFTRFGVDSFRERSREIIATIATGIVRAATCPLEK